MVVLQSVAINSNISSLYRLTVISCFCCYESSYILMCASHCYQKMVCKIYMKAKLEVPSPSLCKASEGTLSLRHI